MLPNWVAGYVGLPFAPGGRSRAGLDCWGLVALAYRERFARDLPDYDGPFWEKGASADEIEAAAAAFSKAFVRVPEGEEREGDIVLARMAGAPIHVGLVIQRGFMLHIEQASDSCVERYDRTRWASRVEGIYRLADG
jgi:cell wall-associated NlpC family hydrolase